MTYRIEIYRPHPDSDTAFARAIGADPIWLMRKLKKEPPGTFALVIGIDGDEETVLERWRVSADGRILRAVYDVREKELELTT